MDAGIISFQQVKSRSTVFRTELEKATHTRSLTLVGDFKPLSLGEDGFEVAAFDPNPGIWGVRLPDEAGAHFLLQDRSRSSVVRHQSGHSGCKALALAAR